MSSSKATARDGKRLKKKKQRAETAEDALEAADEQPPKASPSSEAPKKGKKRRREAGQEEAAAQAPPSEAAQAQPSEGAVSEDQRRNAQREIQKLVVRLRAEGKSEREIKLAKRELKTKFGPLHQPESKQAQRGKEWKEWVKSDEGAQQRKSNLEREHELVVIPVLWRGRHDKEDILRAAEDVRACVAQQGVDVWVDSRRHYSPGQKFAHWEYRGVLLRVEVGPEDVSAGVCRVCRAKTPGDYQSVERRRVRLPPAGARKLLLLLKEWGLEQIAVERREGEAEEDSDEDEVAQAGAAAAQGAGAVAKGGPQLAAAPLGADDIEGNYAPREAPGKPREKKFRKGGKRKAA